MPTIALSLSPTQTIQCLWTLSTIGALWTPSGNLCGRLNSASIASASMANSINGRTSTTLYLDIQRVAVGPGDIIAARLAIFSRECGAVDLFTIGLSRSARRAISLAMSSKK